MSRNILIIQTDAHHHRHFGFQGAAPLRTPNLDAFVRDRAVWFDNAYTCSGVCVPSRVSLVTGRYSIGHGVTNNYIERRPPTEPSLGRTLRQAGHATGFFGKPHFAWDDNDLASDGWSESFTKINYADYLREHGVPAKYPEKTEIDRWPLRYWTMGTSRIPGEHYFENVVGDQAARFLRNHAHEPFAAYVSFVAPHGPFTPPAPYDRLYDPATMRLMPRCPEELEGKLPPTRRWIGQNQRYLNDAELRQWMAIVFGLITLVDDNVGKLLRTLDELQLWENTLVVFLSDHGDFATRYGIIGKSWCMGEDLLRIPLAIWAPGCASGWRCPALAQNLDVTSTVLEWAGHAIPPRLHGRSLLPLLRRQVASVRDAAFAYDQSEYSGGRLHLSTIIADGWKLIAASGFAGELYHLHQDPLEQHNLIADARCREEREALRQRLLDWHLECSGGFFASDQVGYWEDQTAFYDESRFCGERLWNLDKPAITL